MNDSLKYNSAIQPSKTPKQKRSVKTRQKIMDSALELFALYGYDDTSINMITEKAGIALGSFYSHFENKEEIFLITLENHVFKLENFACSMIDDISDSGLPLDESIDLMISVLAEESSKYQGLNYEHRKILLVNQNLRDLYFVREKKVASHLKTFFLKFDEQIHDRDWDSFAIIVMHMVFSCYARLLIDDRNIDPDRVLDELKRSVKYMIIR